VVAVVVVVVVTVVVVVVVAVVVVVVVITVVVVGIGRSAPTNLALIPICNTPKLGRSKIRVRGVLLQDQ
ncbi:hypothetical protein Tco_0395416, partial [Tanacetum coccineum]